MENDYLYFTEWQFDKGIAFCKCVKGNRFVPIAMTINEYQQGNRALFNSLFENAKLTIEDDELWRPNTRVQSVNSYHARG